MKISISIDLPEKAYYRWLKFFAIAANICALLLGWNYYDVMWWSQWYRLIEANGLSALLNIYKVCSLPDCKVPYPPLAVIIFIPVYALSSIFPPIIKMVILKSFIVVLPSLAIFFVIKRLKGFEEALLWLASWPLLQILFAFQFDVLIALLLLLSTIYITRERSSYAAIFLSLAAMIKHVVCIVVPLHLIFLKIMKGWKEVAKYLVVYIVTVGAVTLPFFISTPNEFLNQIVLFHSARAPQDVSLWAIATILLENQVEEIKQIVGNLWVLLFFIVYILIVYTFWSQLKHRDILGNQSILSIYTSIILLIFISLNKVGNLNYVVWFIPTAFAFLNRDHIRTLYKLTFVLGIAGGLIYAFMLLVPPASVEGSVFIAEDQAYWSAKAIIAQSLNPYIFSLLSSLSTIYETYISEPLSTPTDFVTGIRIFKILFLFRSYIILFTIIISQVLLLILITSMIRWVKEYIP
jgi:uncharacterized membrane protein